MSQSLHRRGRTISLRGGDNRQLLILVLACMSCTQASDKLNIPALPEASRVPNATPPPHATINLNQVSQGDRKAPKDHLERSANQDPAPPLPSNQEQQERTSVTDSYPWLDSFEPTNTLRSRVDTPDGFLRKPNKPGSFAQWLRTLPLKKGLPAVFLHNGQKKLNQSAHAFVIDIDTGVGDLQQCADAVMRLRAEFLYSHQAFEDIHFHFTSGDRASYSEWRKGYRPQIRKNKAIWSQTAGQNKTYQSFRRYLRSVFTYAGTASLHKELTPRALEDIEAGDVFILGGYPGHAVIVVDIAYKPGTNKKLFLLAQSYMPAQDMHILRNPEQAELSPWYSTDFGPQLITPEWRFNADALMHFKE